MALQTRRTVLTWERLVFWSGLAAFVALALVAATRGDLEAGMVALGFGLSWGLLRFRGGLLGKLGIGFLSAITLFFMVTAAVTNARSGSLAGAVLLSSGLAAIAFTGLASAAGALANRARAVDAPRSAWLVPVTSLLLFIGLWAFSLMSADPTGPAADASLEAKNVAFSNIAISVVAGEVTVAFTNRDLFWHTFTIESLGVDLAVPVGATRSITFEVEPGTYEFKCRIPGHPEAGMVGTLTAAR